MISRTLTQIAAHHTLIPWMTCLGLLVFVLFFTIMLLWTHRRANAPLYRVMSHLPLEDDRHPHNQSEVLS